MKDQKKGGVLISYLNIVLSLLSNFLLVPMMLAALSDEEYSIYKVMQSFSGPLIILNLGISTVTARAVARARAAVDGSREEKENTLALAMLLSWAMAALVIILGMLMQRLLPALYGRTYSPALLEKAAQILTIFAATTAVRILNDTYRGCILGSEHFVCYYGELTVQYVLRFSLVVLLLNQGADAVAVAMVDLVICVLVLGFNGLYTAFRLRERFRLHHPNWQELKGIAAFSAAILLQALVNQVNSNLDLVILGTVVVEKEILTMYSSALSIYTIYNSVISVFVSICFPKATRMVMQNRSGEELTDFVIGPGRIQTAIALGILTAFALFGRDFISIWIGPAYLDAYEVALMLMIPMTIPLVQNVCLSILDAQLKRLFRSVVLVIMAALNVILSVILVRIMGFRGAALGTALSLLIGHGVLMNLYYHRVIGLNVPRMFRELFRGILPAGMLCGICCVPLTLLKGGLGMFVIKCAAFAGVYAAALWIMGLNPAEKAGVIKMVSGSGE